MVKLCCISNAACHYCFIFYVTVYTQMMMADNACVCNSSTQGAAAPSGAIVFLLQLASSNARCSHTHALLNILESALLPSRTLPPSWQSSDLLPPCILPSACPFYVSLCHRRFVRPGRSSPDSSCFACLVTSQRVDVDVTEVV